MYSSEALWEASIGATRALAETRWSRAMPEAVGAEACFRACWPGVGRLEGPCAILSKWFLPTRLETRTKESKTNASVVVEKPTREMKVNDAKATAASTDHDPLGKGLSESVILRTRKMVNYACVG